jgi:hypothetical protein
MQQKAISDFSQRESWTVESAVRERFGRPVEMMQADVEMRLDPAIPVLTDCPAIIWRADDGATFVLCKVGDGRYRCQFYYSVREQYGTERHEYDDLALCVSTLLKRHEDFEKERAARLASEREAQQQH